MESFSKEKGFFGSDPKPHRYGVAPVCFRLFDAFIIII
jgi:hypothetical protein